MHGEKSTLLSAKIVVACITSRRVYFDLLLLMKDLLSARIILVSRKETSHIIIIKRVYRPSVLKSSEVRLVSNTA